MELMLSGQSSERKIGLNKMEKVVENKTVRCRYGCEEEVLKEQANFGWKCISKVLLNRFGNPLPVNERVSESDKREKCSWDLCLNRIVTPDQSAKLAPLEYEYNSCTPVDTSFGKGKITALVFITIGVMILIMLGLIYLYSYPVGYQHDDPIMSTTMAYVYFTGAAIGIGGLIGITVPGAFSVRKRVIRNEQSKERKKQIIEEVRQILNK